MKPPEGTAESQGWKLTHLRTTATVHIGAHGIVGTGPAHIQMCSVPGLDEPDEIPTLSLRPDRKPCRDAQIPAQSRSLSEVTASPSGPQGTHVAILARQYALLDALWGGCPVDLPKMGVRGCSLRARPLTLGSMPFTLLCPTSRPALTMRGSRLMSCRSRDST